MARRQAGFTAAGHGALAATPRLSGVWQAGFTAAGVGALAVAPGPGRRSAAFTAAGLGGMAAWPLTTNPVVFQADGIGAMALVVRVGSDTDNLDGLGVDLALTDPLLFGWLALGEVLLYPPDEMEEPGYDTDDPTHPGLESYTDTDPGQD